VFHPVVFCFDHGVERGDQFSHGGDHGHLKFFPIGDESVEKFLERWVVSHGAEDCHI